MRIQVQGASGAEGFDRQSAGTNRDGMNSDEGRIGYRVALATTMGCR